MTRTAAHRPPTSSSPAGAAAPGGPGVAGRWADAAKSAIGTAVAESSPVWFSVARGVITEVFYPAPDRACTSALGFVVTDDAGFVSDEATQARHEVIAPPDAAALAATTSTCVEGRYRIEKETLSSPDSAVVLQRVRFVPTHAGASLRLFCILEPHFGEDAESSTA